MEARGIASLSLSLFLSLSLSLSLSLCLSLSLSLRVLEVKRCKGRNGQRVPNASPSPGRSLLLADFAAFPVTLALSLRYLVL